MILVGAHYDSVPDTPGADDNASGIAAMLACARALSRFGRPRRWASWPGTAEEDGLLGSVEFVARHRSQGGGPIAAVHVLEMVGYASHEPGSQRIPVPIPGAPDVGDFIGLLTNQRSNHLVGLAAKQAEAMVPELPVVGLKVYLGLEEWLPVLHRSDHSPFWKAKIPAMLWTDTAEFRNPNYHRPTDTPRRSTTASMRRVTQLVLATVMRRGPSRLNIDHVETRRIFTGRRGGGEEEEINLSLLPSLAPRLPALYEPRERLVYVVVVADEGGPGGDRQLGELGESSSGGRRRVKKLPRGRSTPPLVSKTVRELRSPRCRSPRRARTAA